MTYWSVPEEILKFWLTGRSLRLAMKECYEPSIDDAF